MEDSGDEQSLLHINSLLLADNIERVAFSPSNIHQTLAIVLGNSDIILWQPCAPVDEPEVPVLRWLPWHDDKKKRIQDASFQPYSVQCLSGGTQLVVITHDGSIYILPTAKALRGEPLTQLDITEHVMQLDGRPDFIPTSVVWWSCSSPHHSEIAVIGGLNGELIFFSLTKGQCIASTFVGSRSSITSLSIYHDEITGYSYLLVMDESKQQWKLLLEKQISGASVIVIPFWDSSKNFEPVMSSPPTLKSRFQEFRELSVEKFSILKQKLSETKNRSLSNTRRRLGSSTSTEESPKQRSFDSTTEFSPHYCDYYGDTLFLTQQHQLRHLLFGFFVDKSVLVLNANNQDNCSVLHHKLQVSEVVTAVLLTDTFIYVADVKDSVHRIVVFSTRLSKTYSAENVKFNPLSFVQKFTFSPDERILKLLKMKATLLKEPDETAANTFSPSSIDRIKQRQIYLESELSDTCVVITNKGAYQIRLISDPWQAAVDNVMGNLANVERIVSIFGLNLSVIVEMTADRLIQLGRVESALSLYNVSKGRLVKSILKLAAHSLYDEILWNVEKLLKLSEPQILPNERSYISDVMFMCYTQSVLRQNTQGHLDKFLTFIRENWHYTHGVVVNIAQQSRLLPVIQELIKSRGLYMEFLRPITHILLTHYDEPLQCFENREDFHLLISEYSLIHGLILNSFEAYIYLKFIQMWIFKDRFREPILQRLWKMLNPTQSTARPVMGKLFEIDPKDIGELNLRITCNTIECVFYEWITTFLMVHELLCSKSTFKKSLVKFVLPRFDHTPPFEHQIDYSNFATSPILSSGNCHSAIVVNASVFTWGKNEFGCLGNGPDVFESYTPSIVGYFSFHKLQVYSVACGKCHTLALTNNGVYAWGSSRYGQLGMNDVTQSPYPRPIEELSHQTIVYIAAGQYHSMAINSNGRLWTWGWGTYGQLGHSSTDDERCPKEMTTVNNVKCVAGGQAHTIALDVNGQVWSFGSGIYGQLGNGSTEKSTKPVKTFVCDEKIVDIAAGYFHNLALSSSNRLYKWGCSPQILRVHNQAQRKARLLLQQQESTSVVDTEVQEQLSSIDDTSKDSVVAIVPTSDVNTTTGLVPDEHLSPTLVDTSQIDASIKQISCGNIHCALVSSTGRVYTWGRNTEGQLGCSKKSAVPQPMLVNMTNLQAFKLDNKKHTDVLYPEIEFTVCGKDFTLALQNTGQLLAWGNNCLGQLGTKPQEELSLKQSFDGKFIMGRSSKRMIKYTHTSVNSIDCPQEVPSIPKQRHIYNQNSSYYLQQIRVSREVSIALCDIKETCYLNHMEMITNNCNQNSTHYLLESLHDYYDPHILINMYLKNKNYQGLGKIYQLFNELDKSLYYNLKSVKVELNEAKWNEDLDVEECLTISSIDYDVINVKQLLKEAKDTFEYYYQLMSKENSPEKVALFLQTGISFWVHFKFPVSVLLDLFSQRFQDIMYPLSVMLFCFPNEDEKTSKVESEPKYCEVVRKRSRNSSSNDGVRYFGSSYGDLYLHNEPLSSLDSNDNHIMNDKLNPEEILSIFPSSFQLQLCTSMTEYISQNGANEVKEFTKLLDVMCSGPSILKDDDRNANDILNCAMRQLNNSQCYIHIPYNEMPDITANDVITIFSCGHHYQRKDTFSEDVKDIHSKMESMNLTIAASTIHNFYLNNSTNEYQYPCPKCVFRYVNTLVK